MKTGLLFKLACLLIASMVLAVHFVRKAFDTMGTSDNPAK